MTSEENLREQGLNGVAVSEGIAIGLPFFLASLEEEIPEFPITISEVDAEIARYRQALFSSKEDLNRLRHDLSLDGSSEAATLIDTHIQMLDDPFIKQVEDHIRQMMKNTESVFRSVIRDYEQQFTQRTQNIYFEQRLVDVRDLSERILNHLRAEQKTMLADVPTGSIIVAKELAPSHAAAAHAPHILGFVTENDGGNSHAALIARAKGIPYVAGIDINELQTQNPSQMIVDGTTGEVILNPEPHTLREYQDKRAQMATHYQQYEKQNHLKTETQDGFKITLMVNVGNPEDLDLFPYAHEGIGLFRTEYLFLHTQKPFPSEEQQMRAYRAIIDKVAPLPILMRVFDLGGDKHPALFPKQKEPNPVLGCRGIRFLLREREMFKVQLRAIFKASGNADVRLMLPLISDISELRISKEIIEEVKEQLRKEGIPVRDLPIGCMIEVPSAVMICDAFSDEADFLSIGTNDLMQYTLGVDRSNPAMSNLFYPAHPSVLRMIKMICHEAQRWDKPVSICGEIASNPLFTPLLIGLGLRIFSCAPRYLPLIKQTVRKWTILEAYELAEEVLQLNDPHAVSDLLQKWKAVLPR